jgi:two-component system alkaline phosphatase synthesis response regulator PhoP
MPELVILDIMLPESNGFDILKKLRTHNNTADIPVIMITARTSEADRVKGFDYGADDYISKPFSLIEFLARVRAVLRRSAKAGSEDSIRLGDLELDIPRHTVKVKGRECEFTYKEFELLRLLISNPDRVFTRDVIMDRVWGVEYVGESRTVDMHIKTLRRKLGVGGDMIKTIRNVGYKISL